MMRGDRVMIRAIRMWPLALAVLAVSCGAEGPENVGRKAVQSFIDNDEAAYAELVHPKYRGTITFDNPTMPFTDFPRQVRGCSLDGAKVGAEEPVGSATEVTVLFAMPCGSDPGGEPIVACIVLTEKINGQWYVAGPAVYPTVLC
jgi:hypothetical protein